MFAWFLVVRKRTSKVSDMKFSIVKIIDKTNKNKNIYFEINNELSDFLMTTLNSQFNELVKVALDEKQTDDKKNKQAQITDKSAKNLDFFYDNNNFNKPERKYTTTKTKSRNVLSNISHVAINKEDLYNENFIFDVYLLVTKILNPFSLDRKLNDQNKQQMIYVL